MAARSRTTAWFGRSGGAVPVLGRLPVSAGAWVLASGLLLTTCQQRPAPAGTGLLQLELGGDNEPLAHQLREAGVVLPERPRSSAVTGGAPAVAVPEAVAGGTRGVSEAVPGSDSRSMPAGIPDAAHEEQAASPAGEPNGRRLAGPLDADASRSTLTVQLAEGETLSTLARRHLGKSSRWPEIARLNGWTEAQARRLRAGTVVRLP